MTQNVSDIVALAHTIGMAGCPATKDNPPASDNADNGRSVQNESHFALATRLGLPGFKPAAGASR